VEDDALLRGAGRYTADHAEGALVAVFVRSTVANARILALDLEAAREIPNVVSVLSMVELGEFLPREPAALDSIINSDGTTTEVPPRPALATDRLRFVGEPFALVIARTEAAARDGAEAVQMEFEELPSLATLSFKISTSATVHDTIPDNIGFDWQGGGKDKADAAFANARHRVAIRVRIPRILGAPLEPFACRASFDPDDQTWTLVTPSQGAHAIRRELADGYLNVPHDRLRVITPDVGGAFGIRIHSLPEQAVLLAATRLVGAPLIWRCDRAESNLCEPHARDFLVDAELALDAEGSFLALRADAFCNLGAYVHPGARATPTASFLFGLQGAYCMQAASLRMRGLYTNTVPTGPFRGAGQPEGTYVIERLIDRAARQIGQSARELRVRNVLKPSHLPYTTAASRHVIEDCDPEKVLRAAEAWLNSRPPIDEGKVSGASLALYIKVNGMGRQEHSEISVCAKTGTIRVTIGSQSNGQGHATTFRALVAERLGLDASRIQIVQGDTAAVKFGTGTGASSALGTTGAGVTRSCADLLKTALAAASVHFNVEQDEVYYDAGSLHVRGTNRFALLEDLAGNLPNGLWGRSEVGVNLTYTFGCHACRVTVDRETAEVKIVDYAAFDDLGPLQQPTIALGQIHGGITQGIAQALYELMHYDSEGAQPLTATFLDYQLARAADLPTPISEIAETPSIANDLGVRGAGEAGAVASMAVVVNAVDDALGGIDIDAPLRPSQLWHSLQQR
jgi:carbon-monoxide dehydrogenase large subunit